MWGYRAQIDRELYKHHLQQELLNTPNLDILEAPVEDLIIDHNKPKLQCSGIVLSEFFHLTVVAL